MDLWVDNDLYPYGFNGFIWIQMDYNIFKWIDDHAPM